MKIIESSFKILTDINAEKFLSAIENAGRLCYKSEGIKTKERTIKFVKNIIKRGHESVLEHQSISVHIICDRGISHEIVRHRLASYSQESTRFCNYSKDQFDCGITIIHPKCLSEKQKERREKHFWNAQELYNLEINEGLSPQIARGILPTALKTEIIMTMNLREWRYFFYCRAVGKYGVPHPQMLEITIPMLREFQKLLPVIFEDILE